MAAQLDHHVSDRSFAFLSSCLGLTMFGMVAFFDHFFPWRGETVFTNVPG